MTRWREDRAAGLDGDEEEGVIICRRDDDPFDDPGVEPSRSATGEANGHLAGIICIARLYKIPRLEEERLKN